MHSTPGYLREGNALAHAKLVVESKTESQSQLPVIMETAQESVFDRLKKIVEGDMATVLKPPLEPKFQNEIARIKN